MQVKVQIGNRCLIVFKKETKKICIHNFYDCVSVRKKDWQKLFLHRYERHTPYSADLHQLEVVSLLIKISPAWTEAPNQGGGGARGCPAFAQQSVQILWGWQQLHLATGSLLTTNPVPESRIAADVWFLLTWDQFWTWHTVQDPVCVRLQLHCLLGFRPFLCLL